MTWPPHVAIYKTIPCVIAYANELVKDPIAFEPRAGELCLTYRRPRRSDWVHGILRARVRDLRDKPGQRGPERMRKLNTRRQWRAMDKLLCQVCGRPATDPETGRIPWLLVETVFEETGEDSGRTNAPPTCWSCIPKALEECPMLQDTAMLCTAASATSAGVLADLYVPSVGLPALTHHNVFVAWDAVRYHPYALAAAHVAELHGITPISPCNNPIPRPRRALRVARNR